MKTSAIWALLLVVAAMVRGAESTSAVTFRNIDFVAAGKAATAEHKLILIDFYTTWCEPCKRLDRETWSDPAVGKTVDEKAVALRLDAEKEGKDLAQRYKISAYPTILILKADGTEIDRHVGFVEPPGFTTDFRRIVALGQSGKTALAEAKEVVAQQAKPEAPTGEPEDAQPHFDLAKKLIAAGKSEEALKELLWCWDEGKKDPEFARMRSMQVSRELGRLARDYPTARDAMVVRRDQARERAIAGKGGNFVIQDLIALNKELKNDDDTIAVFDQIPAGDRRRVSISIYLFDAFLERKRYADALLFNMPETTTMEIERAKTQMKSGGEANEMVVHFTVVRLAKRVEALAGAGRLDEARELGRRVLELDGSDSTKALLHTHVTRAGQPDLFNAQPAKST